MSRYDVWATDYEKEHWNAAVSGADYAARLLKNFKVLRLKLQWDFTQLSVPSVFETLKELSSLLQGNDKSRKVSFHVPSLTAPPRVPSRAPCPAQGTRAPHRPHAPAQVNYELWRVAGKRACWLALRGSGARASGGVQTRARICDGFRGLREPRSSAVGFANLLGLNHRFPRDSFLSSP